MRIVFNIFVGFLIFPFIAASQPDNDFCLDAIRISDVTRYCSKVGEFTNAGATYNSANDVAAPDCWTNTSHDIWFRFVAVASDVQISVNGTTLRQPEIELYSGSCSNLTPLFPCVDNPTTGISTATLYKGGLTIGTTYFIRIDGSGTNVGSFQLCIDNFKPASTANGDCISGSILCSKAPFHVQTVSGPGRVTDEANNTCLDNMNSVPGATESETNSTWYKFTAANTGTLTMLITPDDLRDDMDFAIYELPNGLNNCTGKVLVRCGASQCCNGRNCSPGNIIGPTGMRDNATDINENGGCQEGQDSYIRSLDMQRGKSYALIINNFSAANKGFFIEFGGTGEFLGPEPNFTVNPLSGLKCGQPFTITDSSKSNAVVQITNYIWNFGDGALPAEVRVGKGPNQVNYRSFGKKDIVLTVETDKGCSASVVKTIDVLPCCEDLPTLEINASKTDPLCNGLPTGSIRFGGNGGTPDYSFSFNNSSFKRQADYSNLAKGNYLLKVIDAKGCRDSTTITLVDPPPISANAGPDQESRLGYEITLNGSYISNQTIRSIRWVPPSGVVCDSCLMTEAIPPGSTSYKLVVTTVNGCTAVDSMFVNVSIDRSLYVPNVFTPNRDGRNRIFKFYGNRAISGITYLRVFNRWGGLVYEGKNLNLNNDNEGWDGTYKGKPQPSGVYVYVASVLFVDQVERIIKGDVTLLR